MEALHDFGESPDAPQSIETPTEPTSAPSVPESGDADDQAIAPPAPATDADQSPPIDDPASPPISPAPVSVVLPAMNAPMPDSDHTAPDPSAVSVPAPDPDQSAVNPPVSNPGARGAHLFDAATLGRLGLSARRQKRQARLERLLAHVAAKGHLNVIDVRLLLDIPQRTAEEYLADLIAAGHLERRGQKSKTEYWFVK